MTIEKIEQTVFGSTVEGIQIQLTMAEADELNRILYAGSANPPKDRNGITDYDALHSFFKFRSMFSAVVQAATFEKASEKHEAYCVSVGNIFTTLI